MAQLSYSYSYSVWHGKAVQPTREPELLHDSPLEVEGPPPVVHKAADAKALRCTSLRTFAMAVAVAVVMGLTTAGAMFMAVAVDVFMVMFLAMRMVMAVAMVVFMVKLA